MRDLDSPFLFVPHGEEPSPEWLAAHPDWIRWPATFVPHGTESRGGNMTLGGAPFSPGPPSHRSPLRRPTRVPPNIRPAPDPVAAYRRANAAVDRAMADPGRSLRAGVPLSGVAGPTAPSDAVEPAKSTMRLAQAAANTATDAGSGADSAGAERGRYVVKNPSAWAGRPSVGTGECVPLVQQATGAPLTKFWRPGARVQGNMAIRPGTAIATFDSNGHYTGHAAIYLGQDARGIQVIDQWNNRNPQGAIESQHPPSERTIYFEHPAASRVDQGEYYYVVE